MKSRIKWNKSAAFIIAFAMVMGTVPVTFTNAAQDKEEKQNTLQSFDYVGEDDLNKEDDFDIDDAGEDTEETDSNIETSILKLSRDEVTVEVGKSYVLDYELYPEQTVTFSSDSEKVAKVSEDGRITGVKKGNAVITITAEDGTTAECYVKVVKKPTKIKLNKTKLILKVGDRYTLKASLAPTAISKAYKTVKWSSNNTKVVTVSSTGVIRAKKVGNATVTARTLNGLTIECKITVEENPDE